MSETNWIQLDIEPAPTPEQSALIASLITAELPPDHKTTLHPLLPSEYEPSFSPLIAQEISRVSQSLPLEGGVDLERYLPPSAPEDTSEYPATLRAAYTTSAFLSGRLSNLSLLSEFGKNAWLIHNSQLENLLKGLEEELMALKTECELVNKERKAGQVEVQDEMRRLEERWRKGVGRVLEVELAAEGLRREGLRRQREAAGTGSG